MRDEFSFHLQDWMEYNLIIGKNGKVSTERDEKAAMKIHNGSDIHGLLAGRKAFVNHRIMNCDATQKPERAE